VKAALAGEGAFVLMALGLIGSANRLACLE
jgi:hypothetical protein